MVTGNNKNNETIRQLFEKSTALFCLCIQLFFGSSVCNFFYIRVIYPSINDLNFRTIDFAGFRKYG